MQKSSNEVAQKIPGHLTASSSRFVSIYIGTYVMKILGELQIGDANSIATTSFVIFLG